MTCEPVRNTNITGSSHSQPATANDITTIIGSGIVGITRHEREIPGMRGEIGKEKANLGTRSLNVVKAALLNRNLEDSTAGRPLHWLAGL